MKVPSDLRILQSIYEEYYEVFSSFVGGAENGRESKVFVPIDCKKIAERLNVDPDIVFGRLYYHLEQKYGYRRPDGSNIAFFSLMIGSDRRCVNFPLLASVLAGLQEEHGKAKTATILAWIAIVVSLASAVLSIALGK
ncbi:hypothetical protein [Pseudomonas panipatensis]|uniref:hypothetical protein n=1 Tax=Pseudomonas panipatensis TaxID=428992 RepID=UPI0035B09B8F